MTCILILNEPPDPKTKMSEIKHIYWSCINAFCINAIHLDALDEFHKRSAITGHVPFSPTISEISRAGVKTGVGLSVRKDLCEKLREI